jgi:hypothetical protein
VQFVEASHNPLWIEAIESAEVLKVEEKQISVIGKEYLVAMWIFAGRKKDYQKISLFWDSGILDEDKLFDVLEHHNLLSKWNKEKWRFINEE